MSESHEVVTLSSLEEARRFWQGAVAAIFRQPPPVRLVPAEIRRAFPSLFSLVARLGP